MEVPRSTTAEGPGPEPQESDEERRYKKAGKWIVAVSLVVLAAIGIVWLRGSRNDLRVDIAGSGLILLTNVKCVHSGTHVTVTGTVTGLATTPPSDVGISATVATSRDYRIGHGGAPLMAITATETRPVDFTVPISGSPASCVLRWGGGPPIGYAPPTAGGAG